MPTNQPPDPKHVVYALEIWCKNNKLQARDGQRNWFYTLDGNGFYVDGEKERHNVLVNHEFCHEIIKGLDKLQKARYLLDICDVLELPKYMSGLYDLANIIPIHTATVDQMLEAIYRAMHG